MTYETDIDISIYEKEKWNTLLKDDIDQLPKKIAEQYNAKKYDCIGGFYAQFGDNSYLTIDLCSGGSNYYDEVIFYSGSRNYIIDCAYEIANNDLVFQIEDNTYIVHWNVVENVAA